MATMGSLNPSSKTSKPVSLVIFEGGRVQGVLESQMQMVRQGMVLDLVERAREAGFTHILVVTSYPELALGLEDAAVEVVLDKEIEHPFHFGQRLRDVVEGCQLEKVLYMGGAAAPLISSGELQYMREILEQNEEVFLTNNYYSASSSWYLALSTWCGMPSRFKRSLSCSEASMLMVPTRTGCPFL